jgi:hypothetical protein
MFRLDLRYTALSLFLAACQVHVDPADQTCTTVDDCELVSTRCSCDCGTPVNVDHVEEYADKLEAVCAVYTGPMCGMYCDDVEIACEAGVCVVVEE